MWWHCEPQARLTSIVEVNLVDNLPHPSFVYKRRLIQKMSVNERRPNGAPLYQGSASLLPPLGPRLTTAGHRQPPQREHNCYEPNDGQRCGDVAE